LSFQAPPPVILSPSPVILSAAKNLNPPVVARHPAPLNKLTLSLKKLMKFRVSQKEASPLPEESIREAKPLL
jgi:hypothetical protein